MAVEVTWAGSSPVPARFGTANPHQGGICSSLQEWEFGFCLPVTPDWECAQRGHGTLRCHWSQAQPAPEPGDPKKHQRFPAQSSALPGSSA